MVDGAERGISVGGKGMCVMGFSCSCHDDHAYLQKELFVFPDFDSHKELKHCLFH